MASREVAQTHQKGRVHHRAGVTTENRAHRTLPHDSATEQHFPRDPAERRDAALVAEADAAVVVRDDRNASVRMILRMVEQRGIPLHVIDD